MIAWLAVVLLGLADAEGAAVVIAFISLTLAWLAVLTAVSEPLAQSVFLPGGLLQFLGSAGGVPVVLASLAACSLAFSPGPRRGLAIVGWRRACLRGAVLRQGGVSRRGYPCRTRTVDLCLDDRERGSTVGGSCAGFLWWISEACRKSTAGLLSGAGP